MIEVTNLRKTGTGLEFNSEADLEDFVWQNLSPLMNLIPLQRQYCVKGQICDIIAAREDKSLVILELKNTEDRGIVQQLTRYYDVFQEAKPFQELLAYEKPVSLIAIAPSFHKDNFVDAKYHKLFFSFLRFGITQDEQKLYFYLADIDNNKLSTLEIPCSPSQSLESIPNPPRAVRNLLAKCSVEQQEAILGIRSRILSFDPRVQEVIEASGIKYGRGKSKPCAELRFDSERNSLALFLWIPHVSTWKKRRFIARMRVWTDWKSVSDVGHVPKALGRMITQSEWKAGTARPLRKLTKGKFLHSATHKSPLALPIRNYMAFIEEPNPFDSLEPLVDIALAEWLRRI